MYNNYDFPYTSNALALRTPLYSTSWGQVFGISSRPQNTYFDSVISKVKYESS